MGEPIIIYGKSGSGKSSSIETFAEDEIFLINASSKRLPFQKDFKYVMKSTSVPKIIKGLKAMTTKVAVVDDATFIMTREFMKRHGSRDSDQFGMYNDIANGMDDLFESVVTLPDDVRVYIILHEEESDYGSVKLRTIGKLLDSKCPLAERVTVCLRCVTDGQKHYFRTQSDGRDLSKSPKGMFDLEIENDLKAVDKKICEYWNIK